MLNGPLFNKKKKEKEKKGNPSKLQKPKPTYYLKPHKKFKKETSDQLPLATEIKRRQ